MMTMIPTSYFSKDLYTEIWGDPRNPNAVDVPPALPNRPDNGHVAFNLVTLASSLRQRLGQRPAVIDDCSAQACL